jgi:signal peptidase I
MKKLISFVFEVAKMVGLAALIVLPIRYFIFQPFFVQGISMKPNFETGDYLIIDELTYRFRDPQRGEVIVFKYPKDPTQRYIKRIIGLPNETVEVKDGNVTIFKGTYYEVLNESQYLTDLDVSGNVKVVLGEDEYFVLGDNRDFSSDSRRWGAVPRDNIVGRALLRAWPFTALAKIESPNY